jgi:pteridine reductase
VTGTQSHLLQSLAGKRALVTGAGVRVGQAIAVALGEAHMHVAVHHHASDKGAELTCDRIKAAGGEAFRVAADLYQRDEARRLVDESVDRLGGLDLLVGNAANFERVPFDELSDEAWDRSLDLNLTANFVLAEYSSRVLRPARGSMVFVTCSSATTPFRNYLPYVVSKGALRQLVRVLALELAPDVRVNAVAPGTVAAPQSMASSTTDRLKTRIPLARFGSADDVANAVLFLATAPFVTGHELVVDGGRSVAALESFA